MRLTRDANRERQHAQSTKPFITLLPRTEAQLCPRLTTADATQLDSSSRVASAVYIGLYIPFIRYVKSLLFNKTWFTSRVYSKHLGHYSRLTVTIRLSTFIKS